MAIIQSGSTADLLTVDPISKAARTSLYDVDGNPITKYNNAVVNASDEGIIVLGKNDDNYRVMRTDRLGSQAVALNNLLFSERFEGATVSLSRMTTAATTFVFAQTAIGGLNFNNTNVNTATAASIAYSNKQFQLMQRTPLHLRTRARLVHYSNSVLEIGLGTVTNQTTSPSQGAYFQFTTGGVFQGVLTYNSSDTTVTMSLPEDFRNKFFIFDIFIDDDAVVFIIQDTTTGIIIDEKSINLASTQAKMFSETHLRAFCRLHNVGSPATASTMIVTNLNVLALDTFMNKPWPHTLAHNGQGSQVNPLTFAQTANWTNSAAPTSGTLSNTTAAYTTLGGLFQFAAVGGAATDYILFGFTCPAPYSLIVTGIDIDVWNTGAAVATTPTLMIWGCGVDQAAVSLASTITRTPLGSNYFPVGAAIGQGADKRISADFTNSPLVTNSGRFFTVILRMPIGTATASQIIQGLVTVKGYFE